MQVLANGISSKNLQH
ncbi:unnamed protein product [Lathyrus sativus]|nr:unnamed protein product [Lathyrus sativus]